MRCSYNWLQSFFDKKLPKPEKVAEILTMHSFEVEAVEKTGRDFIFDIDILPNRAHDCLCHSGVAKEISAIWDLKIKLPKRAKVKPSSKQRLNLHVNEPALCRRYVGRIIEGVKVGPSPKWIREKLEVVGQKSINNIVDATNYVMLETNQPLHVFDADKVNGGIIVRMAKKGEKIITLDNQEIQLDENTLIIADKNFPLAIAGIKGGKKAEIDSQTKNIILEAANFEPANIRKTSRKLNLRTESSIRFENEITTEFAVTAMNKLTELILEIAGGKAGAMKDFYPKKFIQKQIKVKAEEVEKILGVKIPEKDIIDIFKRFGMAIKKSKGEMSVIAPSERLDLSIKEDLVEEVGRIYGYKKIKAEIPVGTLIPPKRNENYFYADAVRNILLGMGFSEVYNYSFSEKGVIELQNPAAKDRTFLRTNLTDGLYVNIKDNSRYFDKIKIFEIGKIFPAVDVEIISLACAAKDGDFYEVKGIVDVLLQKIGISDFYYKDHERKIADIRVENTSIGVIDHGAFEINFEELVKLANEEMEYRPISKYPVITRDIAVYVPVKTKVIEVLDVIENTAGELLVDSDLFDIFERDNRKSFAFHLKFQSHKKTLSDNEINAIMEKIFKAIESNQEWEVRK